MTKLKQVIVSFIFLATLSTFLPSFAMAKGTDSLSYTDIGQGKPLVLIHAWPTDQRLWKPQQQALSTHFRVITIDLLGFGQADAPSKPVYSMQDYADQVKQLLDKLQIEKAIIGGESMGGYVTLAFLKKYPQHVQGLILADTQAKADTKDGVANREKQAASILADGTAPTIKNFMPIALSSHASAETRSYLLEIVSSQTAKAMAASLLGIGYREDSTTLLKETNLPILILSGELDALISPEQSKNMHALAKNSRLVIIPNAGHLASLEKPNEWNQAVLDAFYDNKNLSKQ